MTSILLKTLALAGIAAISPMAAFAQQGCPAHGTMVTLDAGTNYSGCYIHATYLKIKKGGKSDFSAATIHATNLCGDLSNSDLTDATIDVTGLTANFDGSDLSGARISVTGIDAGTAKGAILSNSIVTCTVMQADWSGAIGTPAGNCPSFGKKKASFTCP